MIRSLLLFTTVFTANAGFAATFPLPPPDVDVIGEVQFIRARHEDTLSDIARRHGLGFNEIIKANPDVDRWLPGEGTLVVLPTRYLLPDAPREGIVVNLSEMRLYYFPTPTPGTPPVVITHPISVGRMDWNTPLGITRVTRKQQDPTWFPPQSIRDRYAREEGRILPTVFPPGPDNPLGRHALYLGLPSYLIHGVNREKEIGIGMRVTHGCIRMYPEDIEALYGKVPVGTKVNLIDQPVKAGWLAGTLFVEIHAPLDEEELPDGKPSLEQVMKVVNARAAEYASYITADLVETVLAQRSGMAVPLWPHMAGQSRWQTAHRDPSTPQMTTAPTPQMTTAPSSQPDFQMWQSAVSTSSPPLTQPFRRAPAP